MIVQELIKLADINEQTRLVCEKKPCYELPYVSEKVKVLQTKFIEMLLSLNPIESDGIIVFEKHWDTIWDSKDGDEKIENYITSELYYREDLLKYLEGIKDIDCPVEEYNDNDMFDKLKELCYKFEQFPIPYAFEFTEWERILGWKVYEDNLEELGIQECIYAILYEMSFNGMTKEVQEERRQELDNNVKESEKIMQLPEDEREKYFISFDELKEQLKDEFEWEEPTQEEMDEEMRLGWLCGLKTSIWRFKNFKKMLGGPCVI